MRQGTTRQAFPRTPPHRTPHPTPHRPPKPGPELAGEGGRDQPPVENGLRSWQEQRPVCPCLMPSPPGLALHLHLQRVPSLLGRGAGGSNLNRQSRDSWWTARYLGAEGCPQAHRQSSCSKGPGALGFSPIAGCLKVGMTDEDGGLAEEGGEVGTAGALLRRDPDAVGG